MFSVLVVEDDGNVRTLMEKVLLQNGFDPIAVENVDEALEVLEHRHVNLVVLDIMLQGTDGYEFAKMLRDSGRDIPILIVTALEDIEHKKKGVKKEKFFLKKRKLKEKTKNLCKTIKINNI